MKTLTKTLLILLLLVFSLAPILASEQVTNASADIMTADIPIMYGDEAFRARIAEKTGGLRSPVGLVLSGGSARAFAHLGVLRMLEEEGIVPDFIISNSMGSIIGLMYAAGMTVDQILESITRVSMQSLFDLTFPIGGGLMESSRFNAVLASFLGPDLKLEELPIPIIVITEDLVTRRQIHMAEGDFYTVMKASYALPVYFPPVEYKGHLLLDGGITNLAPVSLAYEYADSVIVSTTFYDVDTLNLRNPLTILNVSIDIGKRRKGVEELKEHASDVIWIRCAVEDVSFMEFSAVEELARKGYQSALLQKEALSGLPKSPMDAILVERRAILSEKIGAGLDRHTIFSHSKLQETTTLLGLGFDSERSENDDSLLKDANFLGMKYTLRSGDLDLFFNTGMAFQTYTNENMSVAPALRGQLDYYFLNHFKLSLDSAVAWDVATEKPLYSAGLSLDGRISLLDNALRLRLLESLEHISNPGLGDLAHFWPKNTFLFSSTAEAQLMLAQSQGLGLEKGVFSLSYQILSDYQQSRSFLSGTLGSKVLHKSTGLFGDITGTARFALDGGGDVPLFLSDGFRTNNVALNSQGHDLSTTTLNPADHLVVTTLTLGYTPQNYKPTIAELFIIEKSSVGAYLDLVWNEDASWKPSLSLGLELHTELSLLGINTLPVTVYGGWDQSVDRVVWGLWFTVIV
ncbi:MAG: patatin-like phospholipase family protein [Sphaerochaeta sp.]|nr:patatin-like phospholipase family protein [Sphaerochaeta sp.]